MIFERLLKGIVAIVLFLLHLFGWKRADKWINRLMGEGDKDESLLFEPVRDGL